jgi:catechol 2,3-dioxygenase-like lactoylglutathione lyase family enzyme
MHASLYVSDLQKTIQFYTGFFGVGPVKEKPGYVKYLLEKPSLIISFIENSEKVQPKFGHLGFQVETIEDLNLKLWEARKNKMEIKEEFGTTCCYAKQDKFWVRDPDGVQWEVYYFHEDAEFTDPHGETMLKECCAPGEKEAEKAGCC